MKSWKSIAVVLACLLALSALAGASCGSGNKSGEGGEETIYLGAAEAKWPDDASLIQTETWGEVPANQVLVLMEEGAGRAEADRVAQELGGSVVGWVEYISLYQIETQGRTEADLTSAIQKAAGMGGVEEAAPNAQLELSEIEGTMETPLDTPEYRGENGANYRMVGLQDGWDILAGAKALGFGQNKVRIGVVDTALYTKSGELNIVKPDEAGKTGEARVIGLTETSLTDQPAVNDQGQVVYGGHSHSTDVCVPICADPDGGAVGMTTPLGNNVEVVCVNWEDTGFFTEVVNPDPDDPTIYQWDNKSYVCNVLVKIQRAVEAKATIINCSFGPTQPGDEYEPYAKAYKRFLEKLAKDHPEVLVVAAAGNQNTALNGKNNFWGQDLPNLITVTALDNDGSKASFSNYSTQGGTVDVAAPGGMTYFGNDPGGNPLRSEGGTSIATPHVTATAAILRSLFPDLTAEELRDILKASASSTVTVDGQTKQVPANMGKGVLRVDRAIHEAIERKMGSKAPTYEEMLALGRLGLSADGGPLEFTVTASVDAVPPGGSTTLRIELQGQGSIGGLTEQALEAPGKVSWKVTKINPSDTAFIKVTRLDSGAAATLSLTSSPAGTYVGVVELSMILKETGQTISGTADLAINIDDAGNTTFAFSGSTTFPVDFGGMALTETTTASGDFAGMTVNGALEASGGMSLVTDISGAYSTTVSDSFNGIARGTLKDGKRFEGNIEVTDARAAYTATWWAEKQ